MYSSRSFIKWYLVPTLIVVLASLLFALPTAAATFTVTTTDDEIDSATDCVDNPSDCSLREAIEAANNATEDTVITLAAEDYTIELANSSGDEDSNQTGDFDYTNTEYDLTINGLGANETALDGNSLDRILEVNGNGNAVTITDLLMTGGAADTTGIASPPSVTTVYGGVLYAGEVSITIEGVLFQGNTQTTADEGLAIKGGVIAIINDTLDTPITTITETLFQNNSAAPVTDAGLNGGVMFQQGGTVLISNSAFTLNEAETTDHVNYGSVLYLSLLDERSYIQQSLFSSNTGTINGSASGNGLVYSNESALTVENTIFTNNTIDDRGMLFVRDGTDSEVLFSTFVNNTGDAIGVWALASLGDASVTVRSSLFENNTGGNCHTTAQTGVTATVNSGGYNVLDDASCAFAGTGDVQSTDPLLDEDGLQDNGGTFTTYALQSDSPAVDRVPAEECLDGDGEALATDARGVSRPQSDSCDSGAYEFDVTAPVIIPTAGEDTIECAVETWTDAGATATDNSGVTVTASTTDTITNTTLGEQSVVYTSTSDPDGNKGSATRTVTVEDTTAPTVTLVGDSSLELSRGQTYTEQSVTTSDSCDSEVTVTTSGDVDTSTAGTYTVTYTGTDDGGNATSVTRTVIVVTNNASSGTGDGSGDTASTLGDVTAVTALSNNRVRVNYGDGDQKIFKLFPKGSADAKVQLHTNGEVLIAINKTYIRTYNAFTGKRLASKKLLKKKQYKTKFKRWNLYKANSQNNVMVLTQPKKAKKKQFKLRSFVVKSGGKIVVRNTKAVTTNKKVKNFSKLAIKKNKKSGTKARVRVTKNGKTVAGTVYRVTKKKGQLK